VLGLNIILRLLQSISADSQSAEYNISLMFTLLVGVEDFLLSCHGMGISGELCHLFNGSLCPGKGVPPV
jgi:hypothetical protein